MQYERGEAMTDLEVVSEYAKYFDAAWFPDYIKVDRHGMLFVIGNYNKMLIRDAIRGAALKHILQRRASEADSGSGGCAIIEIGAPDKENDIWLLDYITGDTIDVVILNYLEKIYEA